MASLRERPFLIIDCQTTGMRPSVGSLLELAWCWSRADSDVVDIRGSLVELPPGVSIPARVREMTGIREFDLERARAASSLREEFEATLAAQMSDARPIALIHYAQFEQAWLRDFLGVESELPFDLICTHRISKKLFPNVPSRNIRGLTGYFGVRIGEVKRAPQHVLATQKIWQALVPALADIGVESVEGLKAWLSEKPLKKTSKAAKAAAGEGANAPLRTAYEYRVGREKRLALPAKPGIYKMIAKSGEILYVGKATSLKDRVNSYFRGKKGRDPRKLEMMAQVWDLDIVECESAVEAALLESDEIKRLNPPYNVSLKEGNRALIYFDHSLTEESLIHSNLHPYGPFRRFNSIEHLRVFGDGLREGMITNVFYQPIDDRVLEEGYALFEDKYPEFTRSTDSLSIRDHMAFAILLLRAFQKRAVEISDERPEEAAPAVESLGDALDVIRAALDPDVSAEDVCGKIERVYLRAAQTYLRAKQLTQLLWADVSWIEKSEEKRLSVRGGQIRVDANLRPPAALTPWAGLAISDYDRMSVLLMELSKVEHKIISCL